MRNIFLALILTISLTLPAASQTTLTEENIQPQVEAVQSQIMNNPELMKDITNLMADPEIMAALSDPAFVAAIQSQDPAAIENSPHMQELMNNPKMQALIEKLAEAESQQE